MPKIWPWDHALPDSSMNSATTWILLVDYWDCQAWRDLIPCRGLCAKKTFFSSSVLDVLEYDLIFVRLILDCCALDYVICQDVLLKEKQALGTASHITQFSRQIPNACTDFVSSEGDKKSDTSRFCAQFEVSELIALQLTGFQWPGCRWHLRGGIGGEGSFPKTRCSRREVL